MTIIEHPEEFKEGIRVLMLILRGKDGGKNSNCDRSAVRLVSKNKEDFDVQFAKLLSQRIEGERIYSTVDPRDIDKAIHIFKYRQLDAEFYASQDRNDFYLDIHNRWISAISNPAVRKSKLFMVDVDYPKDDEADIRRQIKEKGLELVHEYETKNGKHFILKPFNPKDVTFDVLSNHMMLWVY